MTDVFNKIVALLNAHDIKYEVVRHKPTSTSEESALARGESLSNGAKALLIKGQDHFFVFVISASDKLDSAKARSVLGLKKIRFATREEFFDLTDLYPGSLPPFGQPVLPVSEIFTDIGLKKLKKIAFNAGSLEVSIKMSAVDYLRVINKKLYDLVQ